MLSSSCPKLEVTGPWDLILLYLLKLCILWIFLRKQGNHLSSQIAAGLVTTAPIIVFLLLYILQFGVRSKGTS